MASSCTDFADEGCALSCTRAYERGDRCVFTDRPHITTITHIRGVRGTIAPPWLCSIEFKHDSSMFIWIEMKRLESEAGETAPPVIQDDVC